MTTQTTYTFTETKEQLVERLYKAGYITFSEALFIAKESSIVQELTPPIPWINPSNIYPNPSGPFWDVAPYLHQVSGDAVKLNVSGGCETRVTN